MIYLFMRYRVKHYTRWKETFDMHLASRQAGGATSQVSVMRNVGDLNEMIILLGWQDLKTAQLFVQSISLQMFIQNAGVLSLSEIHVLEFVS